MTRNTKNIGNVQMTQNHGGHKLSAFPATAICGNDILSSVLYVSGLVIPVAGIWAPVAMLLVGFVLFYTVVSTVKS